jgi:hypothetical protein
MTSPDHELILGNNHILSPLNGSESMIDTKLGSNEDSCTNEPEIPAANDGEEDPDVDPEDMCSICLHRVEDDTELMSSVSGVF